MPSYGTMMLSDLLATVSQTAAQFGEEMIWDVFERSLAAHNRQMNEMIDEFVMFTTERLMGSGGIQTGDFEELHEFTTPRPQKVAPGQNLGFPMRNYGYGQQWTDLYLEEATVADVAGQFVAVLDADKRNIMNRITTAMYLSVNYPFVDIRRKDNVTLPVKRLANADGFQLPVGPNGEFFNGTSHTHYLARVGGSFVSTDLDALITTVQEHYAGTVVVAINPAQEAAFRAFTNFQALVDVRIHQAYTAAYAEGGLDVVNPGNRQIGIYNGAEIWVKAWGIPNYVLAWNRGGPKVVGYRTRTAVDSDRPGGQLRPIYKQRGAPLTMEGWAREFGVGVVGRVSAAVLYIAGASYVDPTITAAA